MREYWREAFVYGWIAAAVLLGVVVFLAFITTLLTAFLAVTD